MNSNLFSRQFKRKVICLPNHFFSGGHSLVPFWGVKIPLVLAILSFFYAFPAPGISCWVVPVHPAVQEIPMLYRPKFGMMMWGRQRT